MASFTPLSSRIAEAVSLEFQAEATSIAPGAEESEKTNVQAEPSALWVHEEASPGMALPSQSRRMSVSYSLADATDALSCWGTMTVIVSPEDTPEVPIRHALDGVGGATGAGAT